MDRIPTVTLVHPVHGPAIINESDAPEWIARGWSPGDAVRRGIQAGVIDARTERALADADAALAPPPPVATDRITVGDHGLSHSSPVIPAKRRKA